MVLIADGNSEVGAHANLCYLICSRHLIRSRAVTNLIFLLLQKRPISFMREQCSELPSNTKTMCELGVHLRKWKENGSNMDFAAISTFL